MLTASVGTLGPNGDERKKTVFRSSSALSTHCTASKLTTNVATLKLANLATRNSPTDRAIQANNVNGTPLSEFHELEKIGLNKPKIIVSAKMSNDDPARVNRAPTARRIRISKSAPKA